VVLAGNAKTSQITVKSTSRNRPFRSGV